VFFSADSQLFAVTASRYGVTLWDVRNGTMRLEFPGHVAAAISPDSQTLATADGHNFVKLWNLQGPAFATLPPFSRKVTALAVSGDGKTLATGSHDQTIKLWDVATRKERVVVHGHKAPVVAVALDQHARNLVSGSEDGIVILWKQ